MSKFNEQLSDWNLRRKLRRHFGPSQKAESQTRERFLSMITPTRTPIHHHIIKWRYALVTVLIALSLMGGFATYADQFNVAPTHPLYQFKRLSERIRLGLSTPQEQVILHQEFAGRRIHEIEEIKAASMSKGPEIEQGLEDDFQKEAETSMDQAQRLNLRPEQRRKLCQGLLNALEHKLQNPRPMEPVRQYCRSALEGN